MWLIGLLVVAASVAEGGQYKGAEGYTLSYPDNWVLLSSSDQAEAVRAIQQLGLKVPPGALDTMSCMLMKRTSAAVDYAPNINVVTARGMPAVNQSSLAEYQSQLQRQLSGSGMEIQSVQGKLIKACGRDALSVNTRVRFRGIPVLVRQTQVVIPSGGRTFFVTFSAAENQYASEEPVFNQVLASMTVPTRSPLLNGTVAAGVIGGLVGLIVWGVKHFQKKNPTHARAAAISQAPPGRAPTPPMAGGGSGDWPWPQQ